MSTDAQVSIHGVNHKSIHIDLRERFALDQDASAKVLTEIITSPGVEEAVVLNTCNRVEIVSAGCPETVSKSVQWLFSDLSGLSHDSVSGALYHHQGADAVSHLFRVASGLDSLVLGEPQVFGQVKQAYRFAKSQGATKTVLNRLFHRAFGIAKRVRTHTGIGKNAVSVCYAAKELAERIFGDLSSARLMLIGAGEMGELALKHFMRAGIQSVFVVNRSMDRALRLVESYGGVALSPDKLAEFLPQVDVVIGVAGGGQFIVSKADAQKALSKRWAKPQFYIDLSVPRIFDPAIEAIEDAFLYNVDDLEAVVRENLSAREMEVDNAELLIQEEVSKFEHWLQVRSFADPLIKEVVLRGRTHRLEEIRRTKKRLAAQGFSEDQLECLEEALDELTQSLLAKTLHHPLKTLKEKAASDSDLRFMFEKLFLGKK